MAQPQLKRQKRVEPAVYLRQDTIMNLGTLFNANPQAGQLYNQAGLPTVQVNQGVVLHEEVNSCRPDSKGRRLSS